MNQQTLPPIKAVDYPDCDGNPMSDNTLQYEYIVSTRMGLDEMFAEDPNVFVAADLLWYPVEGQNAIRQAPDVLVVFGRPKGYRGSYRQWEEDDIAPQVVFEIRSPGNRFGQMLRKFQFYERYGVEEYYLFDPDNGQLEGWERKDGVFTEVQEMQGWVSPRLGIRFEVVDNELRLLKPDNRRFATYDELVRRDRQLELEKQRAEQEKLRAEQEKLRAEQAQERAEQAQERAEQEKLRADAALEELERLRAELKKRSNPESA